MGRGRAAAHHEIDRHGAAGAAGHRVAAFEDAAIDGTISSVAGGGGALGDGSPATAASLSYPYGVALDASYNIYIADSGHNRVRKVARWPPTFIKDTAPVV